MATSDARMKASDREIAEVVKESTPAGTSEIAEQIDMSRQGTGRRLKQLHEQWNNPVWRKKVGPTSVWMHCHRIWRPGWPEDRTLYQEDVLRTDHTYLRRRRRRIVDQREVVEAVWRVAPASTQEVADLLGISRQCMGYRLHALDTREKIWSKEIGPTRVWMHPHVMTDPDPDRDTSAEDVAARVFGDVYRIEQGYDLVPNRRARRYENSANFPF